MKTDLSNDSYLNITQDTSYIEKKDLQEDTLIRTSCTAEQPTTNIDADKTEQDPQSMNGFQTIKVRQYRLYKIEAR